MMPLSAPVMQTPPTATYESVRFVGLDIVRGALMLLVIFGHAAEQYLPNRLIVYILYSFHMPVFLFLSGYVLRRERLLGRTKTELVRSYTLLFWTWLLVSVLWNLLKPGFLPEGRGVTGSLARTAGDTARAIIYLFSYPAYHLWYIPALLLMVGVTYLLLRQHATDVQMRRCLRLLVWASLLTLVVPFKDVILGYTQNGVIRKLFWLAGDTRVYVYWFYFLLGFVLRNAPAETPLVRLFSKVRWLYLFVLAVILQVAFYGIMPAIALVGLGKETGPLYVHIFVIITSTVTSVAAIGMVLTPLQTWQANTKATAFLSWVGSQTLFIYLLHPFFILPMILLSESLPRALVWVTVYGGTVGVLFCLWLSSQRASR